MKIKKRRIDKYNPYNIYDLDNKYILKFRDGEKNEYQLEITKEIYEVFDEFELIDVSQMNKFDRHIEHADLTELSIYNRKLDKEKCMEDNILENIEKKKLYNAVLSLPKLQKRRIYLHYFCELTYREIAKMEKCSIRAIQYSLRNALKNLKNFLNETS